MLLKQGSKQVHLIHRNKHREAAKLRRQRNMSQMKEQIKTPEKELNKTEISNLSDSVFKTLVIRRLKELTGYFNSIKKTQAEMNVTLSEKKKNLQGNNSRVGEATNKSIIWNVRKKKNNQNQPLQKE